MSAIITVCSWITIPFTVPFTMQTFAVFMSLLILGGKKGTLAIALYILLGLVGVPVFSGFQGGAGHILGPTGGYIIGFVFTGLIYLLFEDFIRKNIKYRILILSTGLLTCYITGTIWFAAVFAGKGESYSFINIISLCVLPYIIPDAVKMIIALLISPRISKALSNFV